MIVEIAELKIDPAKHEEFGDVLAQAVATVLSKSGGYRGHSIFACMETPGRYVLQVNWETLEDHTVGFRESAAFAQWRAIIGPYFAQAPHVEHFVVRDARAS
ncbi:antibiotic biosynthesis monooxygenase family protein [Delftia sp. PS-11]|uniref:antibiotic biosynthesis monooxygenase family protein n=1 Tax=Delftia sp. PS-11 TaxID=2767222 RepID=UPI0024555F0B|nr:antibiotic biosynthesis monooxygenase [Delftia sp. PS-11]KAJ8740922.1 antibiotic biosynthesis monooxygenase [Delftia sp. PS-11]